MLQCGGVCTPQRPASAQTMLAQAVSFHCAWIRPRRHQVCHVLAAMLQGRRVANSVTRTLVHQRGSLSCSLGLDDNADRVYTFKIDALWMTAQLHVA